MKVQDSILIGDSTIGNFVVGFFDCRADDGENAESQILKAYRNLGYWNVKLIFRCGTLELVEHEGLNERAPAPESYQKAVRHMQATCGDDLSHQIEMIKKYRTEIA